LLLVVFFLFLSAVRIGLTNFTEQQILENLHAVLQALNQKLPGKWKNIQSLHIKTTESVALPIYNSLPQAVTRITEKAEEKAEEEEVEEMEEMEQVKETKPPKSQPKKKKTLETPGETQTKKKRKL
jgi:ribosome biogenesis protein UTP30